MAVWEVPGIPPLLPCPHDFESYFRNAPMYIKTDRERKTAVEDKGIESGWRKTSGDVTTVGDCPGHAQTTTPCCSSYNITATYCVFLCCILFLTFSPWAVSHRIYFMNMGSTSVSLADATGSEHSR